MMYSQPRAVWVASAVVCFLLLVTWIDHSSSAAMGGAASSSRKTATGTTSSGSGSGSSGSSSSSGSTLGIFHKYNPFASGDRGLQRKLELAERLWKDMTVARKEMLKVANHEQTEFPNGYISPYNVWDYARPAYFCPHDLERVGSLGDGGKWVCGMSRYEEYSERSSKPLVVYSFGINDDSSFEAALLERTNAEIWGYDFSVQGWAKEIKPEMMSRAHFKKAGIAKESNAYKNPPFFSVQDLMRQNNHTYIDIMKMDIEGAEFEALQSLISFIEASRYSSNGAGEQPTLPIGQLLIEIHLDGPKTLDIPKNMAEWLTWWELLERAGVRQAFNEDNWLGNVAGGANGRPRFMEYTIINGLDTKRNLLLQ